MGAQVATRTLRHGKQGNDANEFIRLIFCVDVQMRFTRNRHMGRIGHKHVHYACMMTLTGEATS